MGSTQWIYSRDALGIAVSDTGNGMRGRLATRRIGPVWKTGLRTGERVCRVTVATYRVSRETVLGGLRNFRGLGVSRETGRVGGLSVSRETEFVESLGQPAVTE